MTQDIRRAIIAMLRPSIEGFARSAEERICMHNSMRAWVEEVISQLSHALDDIPDGTSLHPPGALPYTHDDEVAMRRFLDSFKGHGVVCTSMDKAETTLMFMCPKLYVDKLLTDLETGATYQPATLSHADLLHAHNGFCRHYGIPVDMTCQAMPHYVGTCKMHKDPPGMRFISSSNTSSMRSVSLMINRLLTQLLPGLDALFADVFQSVGIDAKWTQHSWILKNTAAAIPLINAWNSIYASHSAPLPRLYTYDFERLYSNIPSGDMHAKIMQVVGKIFASHSQHAGIKVWEAAPAVWLTASQMPARDSDRHGTGYAGNFFIYDLETIAEFLRHLLDDMYVRFGDQLLRQVMGTPMGTNCASLLANFYLAMYELAFLENLANLATDTTNPQAKQTQAKHILKSFLMTGRYIDDLLSINNPYLKFLLYTSQTLFYHDLHGIYPDTLLLKCAHSGTEVPFMDISIRPSGRGSRLTTVLYDKRRHEPLSSLFIIKYPHMSSNISETAKFNIITSQYHRFLSIILSKDNFVASMADVIMTLSSKGYPIHELLTRTYFLCWQHLESYSIQADKLITHISAAVHRLMG